MSTNYIVTNVYLGSGTVETSLSELRGMKASAANLIKEMKILTPNALSQASYVANRASGEYNANVAVQSRAVLTQCDNLSAYYTSALKDLEELVSGIDKVIAGYLAMEQDLKANASGSDGYLG